MGFGDNFLIRPQTLAVFVFIGLTGFLLYSWASTSLADAGDTAANNQDRAIACSGFSSEILGLRSDGNSTTVLYRINKPVDTVGIQFGDNVNNTLYMSDPKSDKILRVTAPVSNVSDVLVFYKGCRTGFE